MLAVAPAPDFDDPFLKPLPSTILVRKRQPVFEVITAPKPTPLAVRKSATSKRLRDESTKTRNNVINRLRTRGAVYKPDRRCPPDPKWDSSSPNHGYLNAYISGIYGTPEDRKLEGFDVGAFERAKAIFAVSTDRPWKGLVQGDEVFIQTTLEDGRWEAIAAQPAIAAPEARSYTPDSTSGTTSKRMTRAGINKAFEEYVTPRTQSDAQLGNLEAALFSFAPTNGRWKECDSLLSKRETYLDPDDIIADFAADLIDRFKKGQYQTHEGKIENWIRHVWQMWFFPDVQTKFYAESNLTCPVNEDDFDNDEMEAEDRISGETYRVDVDMDQANRDKESWNDPARLLDRMLRLMDDPKTVWSRVNETTKEIIRAMVGGATKAEASALAGLSERPGRREFESLTKLASANPEMREQLFVSCADVGKGGSSSQAVGDDADAQADTPKSTSTAPLADMRVCGEDGSGIVLSLSACADSGPYRNFFTKAHRKRTRITGTIDSPARNGDSVQRRRFQQGSVYQNQTGTLWLGKYAEYVLNANGVEQRIRHQIVLVPVKNGEKVTGKREAQRLLQPHVGP